MKHYRLLHVRGIFVRDKFSVLRTGKAHLNHIVSFHAIKGVVIVAAVAIHT